MWIRGIFYPVWVKKERLEIFCNTDGSLFYFRISGVLFTQYCGPSSRNIQQNGATSQSLAGGCRSAFELQHRGEAFLFLLHPVGGESERAMCLLPACIGVCACVCTCTHCMRVGGEE